MNSLLKFRKPVTSSLTSLSLHRFSSTLNYVFEETKEATSFIHSTGNCSCSSKGCDWPGSGAVVGDDLPRPIVIGCNNVIGHHAVVGIKCQDMKYKLGDECFLDVGANNEIREFTSIHRSSKSSDKTVIGDNNLIMGSCHIAHDCKIHNSNIFANSTLLAGHVIVEDYVHTAGAIVVHQFCHIGSFSFIGGGSVVSQDVPKYMMVFGERPERIAVCFMLQSIRDSFTENHRGICKFRQ